MLPSAERLARTLLRLHADRPSRSSGAAWDGEVRGLAIEVNVDPAHAVRVEREDLDEMLGNLLDNACKSARSRIAIASAETGGDIAITVDDAGPGWMRRCGTPSCSAACGRTKRRLARGLATRSCGIWRNSTADR